MIRSYSRKLTTLVTLLLITIALSNSLEILVETNTTGTYNLTGSKCGGNCPSGRCSSCPCGSSKSMVSISSMCKQFSGWKQSSCECIAKHESGGNAHAMLQNGDGSFDVGLWQVNSRNWASCSGGKAPCSTSANLACAKKVFGWGRNTWKYWATCSKCGVCNSN
eukprot:TRINITY_DN4389_c0_g1_i1.p1 TRINITY_DN4389_c0_g1~~TRINITY_DN4389_c0_g1_i1.p1  ORF type:complete len:164 (-),score=14.59 TRINITY_DN4389_c0_g1_i1:43-534(-)